MAAQLDEHKVYQGVDGKPLVDGFLYIGVQGADPKLNPGPIFADRELTIPLANPQILDAFGRAANKVWVPGRYSWLVENVDGVQQFQELDAGDSPSTGVTTLGNVQGTDAITAEAVPAITSYQNNEIYVFTAAGTNTGPVTLDAGGGALPFVDDSGAEFNAGDIVAGSVITAAYSGADNRFQSPGPSSKPLDRWETIQVYDALNDLTINVYHDGIENSGTPFLDGYDYRVDYGNVFGSVDTSALIGQLFQNGTYRSNADDYKVAALYVEDLIVGGISFLGFSTGFEVCGSLFGTSLTTAGDTRPASAFGYVECLNAGSSTQLTQFRSESFGVRDNSTMRSGSANSVLWTRDLLLPSAHFRILNSQPLSVITGRFTLRRRLAT